MSKTNLRDKLNSLAGEMRTVERLKKLISDIRFLWSYSTQRQIELLGSDHVSEDSRPVILKHGLEGAERVWEHETKLLFRRLRRKV